MPQPPNPHSRRQLPENFEPGDQLRFLVTVEGGIVTREQSAAGDWLMTVKVTNITSTALETVGKSTGRKPTERIRPVLWSATASGEVELVLEVGARQRLLALGISGKQKQELRKHLEALPTADAETLLREISELRGTPEQVTGHLDVGNRKGEGHEK